MIQACLLDSVSKEVGLDFVKDFRDREKEARQKAFRVKEV